MANWRTWAPWTDRAGRLSWLKIACFTACVAPAVWMVWRINGGVFHPAPVRGAIRETGDWAMRFIALSLAVTPLRYATRWNRLVMIRRMLGLAGLAYTLAHLAIYLYDREFNLLWIVLELFWRIYISAGWVAVAIFVLMGVTSNDWGVRRLGSARWNRWHAWAYPAAFLSLLHIFILVRLDAYEATLTIGLVAFALGFRTLRRAGAAEIPTRLLALGAGLAVATALFEAWFYKFATRVDMMRVLEANLDFSYRIRPAWWVLAAGGVMAVSAWARKQRGARALTPHPAG